jgi:hypothetical protein
MYYVGCSYISCLVNYNSALQDLIAGHKRTSVEILVYAPTGILNKIQQSIQVYMTSAYL